MTVLSPTALHRPYTSLHRENTTFSSLLPPGRPQQTILLAPAETASIRPRSVSSTSLHIDAAMRSGRNLWRYRLSGSKSGPFAAYYWPHLVLFGHLGACILSN